MCLVMNHLEAIIDSHCVRFSKVSSSNPSNWRQSRIITHRRSARNYPAICSSDHSNRSIELDCIIEAGVRNPHIENIPTRGGCLCFVRSSVFYIVHSLYATAANSLCWIMTSINQQDEGKCAAVQSNPVTHGAKTMQTMRLPRATLVPKIRDWCSERLPNSATCLFFVRPCQWNASDTFNSSRQILIP